MTDNESKLMTPAEVADAFRVDARTIAVWDKEGRFPEGTVIRTLGNTRRFRRDKIMALLENGQGK